jgi:hypothetical protein
VNYDGHIDGRRSYEAGIAAIRYQGVHNGLLDPLPGNAAELALARLGACEREFNAAAMAYAQNSILRAAETGSSRKWFERAYKNRVRAEREIERLEGGE